MRTLVLTNQFEKDLKAAKKRAKDISKLAAILRKLQVDEALPPNLKDHPLKGNWKPCRECHIEPDWLLIYDRSEAGKLTLIRLGTHSDLF